MNRVPETPQENGPVLHRAVGRVVAAESFTPGASRVRVELQGRSGDDRNDNPDSAWAIAYTALVGAPRVGERVLLNTTAVDLRLGTGGVHFVIAVLPEGTETVMAGRAERAAGHLIKLRYTPDQCQVLAAEEEGSAYRQIAEGNEDLRAAPVVVCELHSQIAAVAAGFLASRPQSRVIYVMTPGGALPLWFSELTPALKKAGLLHGTVTAGQSCGGDLEAINLYSGLLMAKHALSADLVVVSQGPGNAGTGTRFGFSGLEQGEAANAVTSLGGQPIVCLRASSADPRERHRTPSHHTLTVLDRIVRCRCTVPIARDAPGFRRRQIIDNLAALDLHERHNLTQEHRGLPGVRLLQASGVCVTTMGRSIEQDQEFFLHASAAGAAAAAVLGLLPESTGSSAIMSPDVRE